MDALAKVLTAVYLEGPNRRHTCRDSQPYVVARGRGPQKRQEQHRHENPLHDSRKDWIPRFPLAILPRTRSKDVVRNNAHEFLNTIGP